MPSGGNFELIAQTGANVTSYGDTGVQPNTTYTYRVRATNSAGDSANTDPASATTPADSVAAPSGLAANPVSSSRIDLVWTDNSNNETGFVVERAPDGGSFAVIASTAANATGYQDTGLSADTSYSYRVKAVNATAVSAYAGPVSARTLPPVPAAPTGLSATAASSTEIDLSWTDNSNNETAFDIERKTGGGSYVSAGSVSANVTTFQDTGLNPATTYTYRVRSRNAGGSSGPSGEASATTQNNPPGGPTGLQATVTNQVYVVVSWTDDDPNVTGYKVERRSVDGVYSQIGTTPAGTTTYNDGPLAAGSTYFYRVRATNSGVDSGYSSEVSVTTVPNPPSAPTSLAATIANATEVDLTWSAGAGSVDGFYVERRIGSGAYSQIGSTAAGVTSYADHSVSAGNTYGYRVRAYNSGGASDSSNAVTVNVPAPPGSPANLHVTAFTDTSVSLAWSPGTGADSYVIERKLGDGSFTAAGSVEAPAAAYTDTGLTAGSTYTYRVHAHNGAGDSAASNLVPVSTARGVLSVSPPQINFGVVRVGQTRSHSVSLRNQSRSESLRVTVGSLSAPWSLSGGGTILLPPNGRATITVSYHPTTAASSSGTLAITSSDPSHSSVSVKLTGKSR